RCAEMSGALGVPWRTRQTDHTSPCTARSARRVRGAACRQVTPADPEGLYHARPTQRWRPALWSHMGGETALSLPRSSGCEAHRVVRFSPPRDGFSRLDNLCNILIKNTLDNF